MMDAETRGEAPTRKRPRFGARGALRLAALAAAALVLLPLLLVPVYALVPPVSNLMLWSGVTGQGMDRRWRALDGIAPALPASVLVSEDARFCAHRGVDWREMRLVLDAARGGRPSRGASTITMQVAKNLFLWPGQSYLRKGLEIGLAHYIDLVWSKRRIMEVYLNIAEWGPGIFGAEAAAQHHFGKSASDLAAREAALLAAGLPNPFERVAGNPGPFTSRMAGTIQARAQGAGPYTACLGLSR